MYLFYLPSVPSLEPSRPSNSPPSFCAKKKKKTQWIIQWEYQADLLKLYQIEICDFFFFLNGSKLRKS